MLVKISDGLVIVFNWAYGIIGRKMSLYLDGVVEIFKGEVSWCLQLTLKWFIEEQIHTQIKQIWQNVNIC